MVFLFGVLRISYLSWLGGLESIKTLAGLSPALSAYKFKNMNILLWLSSSGVKILIIIIIGLLLNLFLQLIIKNFIIKKIKKTKRGKKRINTLVSIFSKTLGFVITIAVILTILPELGVNIAALLAGVGVMGLAVGIASREIVADFLSGIFIIIEDQYQIGDRIKVIGIEGEVKEISLRRTTIQDDVGFKHDIGNSQIKTVAKKVL